MSTVKTVTIRPESSILGVLSHLNYKPWFALSEYVDNSLQSYLFDKRVLETVHFQGFHLKVDIVLDHASNRIIVRDNSSGISAKDFPRAFQAAQIPIDTNGLSEFGMGMKSASCWFARRWSVRTKALGEDVSRTVTFDLAKILKNNAEFLEVEEVNAPINEHYTEVILQDLNHHVKTRTLTKCKAHLASIYRRFLADGSLVLTFEGEDLSHDYPEFLVEPEWVAEGVLPPPNSPQILWKKDLDFVFCEKYRATGFAGIRKEARSLENGLSLFRRNRLIQGTAAEPYRPQLVYGQGNSYESQRVFIELELFNASVSHTKDGFRFAPAEEEELLTKLRSKLNEAPLRLIRQANNYRPTKKPTDKETQGHVNLVADDTKAIMVGPVKFEIEDQLTAPSKDYAPRTDLPDALEPTINTRTISLDFENLLWIISIELNVDPSQGDLVNVSEAEIEGGRRISIRLSMSHPYVRKHVGLSLENLEPIYHLAAAIGLSEVTSRLSGGDNQAARMRVFLGRILAKLSQEC